MFSLQPCGFGSFHIFKLCLIFGLKLNMQYFTRGVSLISEMIECKRSKVREFVSLHDETCVIIITVPNHSSVLVHNRQYSQCFPPDLFNLTFNLTCEVGTVNITILYMMRKLRPRKAEKLAQGHTASSLVAESEFLVILL